MSALRRKQPVQALSATREVRTARCVAVRARRSDAVAEADSPGAQAAAVGACRDFLVGLRCACEVISDAGYSLQAYRILTQSDLARCSLFAAVGATRLYRDRGRMNAADSAGSQRSIDIEGATRASGQPIQGCYIAASACDAHDDSDHEKCRAQCHHTVFGRRRKRGRYHRWM
jgi:hypothetical protein